MEPLGDCRQASGKLKNLRKLKYYAMGPLINMTELPGRAEMDAELVL